jgi:hypothetical protein
MSTPAHHGRRPHAAAILLVPLLAALVLTLFAWPSARLEPRDLPVAVAGSGQAADALAAQLSDQDGRFDVERVADEAGARAAIEDREVYGAFVAGPDGPEVLVSSAASAMTAQLLSHAAAEQQAPVEDVVPASPRATALGSSVLPLVLAGLLTGIAASLLASGALGRAGLVVTGSVLVGLAGAAIVQSWLGVVEGDWWANAGVLSLTVGAIAAAVAGAKACFGHAGAAVTALTMVFVGNPFSGVATAPELLPQPVGGLGQLLPPGAGGNLLRSTGFFDGAGGGAPLAVLACWAVAGLALLALSALRRPVARRSDALAVAG